MTYFDQDWGLYLASKGTDTFWTSEFVSNLTLGGIATSFEYNNEGTTWIAYQDLNYAEEIFRVYVANRASSGWNVSLVAEDAAAVDLAINPQTGYPAIVYFQVTNMQPTPAGVITYASFNGMTWDKEVVSSQEYMGGSGISSLAFDPLTHFPMIAFTAEIQSGNMDLYYASRNESNWSVELVENVGDLNQWIELECNPVTREPSVIYTIKSGHPRYNKPLIYAYRDDTNWNYELVGKEVSRTKTLAFNNNGFPVIAYAKEGGGLHYAYKESPFLKSLDYIHSDTNHTIYFVVTRPSCLDAEQVCTYQWDFGGEGSIVGGNGYGTVVFQYDNPGDYTATLTLTELDSRETIVENIAVSAEIVEIPLPAIDFATTVDLATVSLSITDLDLTDSDVTSVIVFWGDRYRTEHAVSLPATVNHTYARTGSDYHIRVKAILTDGGEFNYTFMTDTDLTVNIPFIPDSDGDGFNEAIDCNDNDASINPGATEVCGDRIDQDCNGSDLLCSPEVIRFSKNISGYLVRQTFDEGYIIAGPSDYNAEIALTKTDKYGNELWSKSGFKSIGAVQFLASVYQTVDGGYIIIGYTGSGQYAFDDSNDVFLIKTDSQGNEVWSKTFGEPGKDDEAKNGQQTSDGGYIVVGNTSMGAPQYANVLLVKFDSNGDKEWDRNFHFSYDDYAYSVQQTIDGGYIIAGMTEQADYINDMLWIKTDANGNITWHKTYDNPTLNSLYWYGPEAHSIRQTSDAGYIIGGSAIVKTLSNGDVEWVLNDKDSLFSRNGSVYPLDGSVQQTSDGGYFYCSGDSFLKTDSNFNEIWARSIGICPSQQTSDRGYIGVNSNNLIKTDSNGEYQ